MQTAEKEELPPLESECGELAVRRDQLLESLKEGEKPQAEEAYALVENKLQSLKPSLEHRRNELKPYAEVEREASHVEDKIVLARGSIHVLMCQVEGKEDGINVSGVVCWATYCVCFDSQIHLLIFCKFQKEANTNTVYHIISVHWNKFAG